VVGVHAGGASVEPDEEGAQLVVHSRIVLELDHLAFVAGWLDAECVVGHRRVDPAVNILLPHVDQLLINKHHAVQQAGKFPQQAPADREPVSLVLICKGKPDPKLLKLEVWVQALNPSD